MSLGNTAPSRDVRLTSRDVPRWFDGRVRAVVEVLRYLRDRNGTTLRIERLDCGHLYVVTGALEGNHRQARFCWDCEVIDGRRVEG